jgi:hypothetical protein
MAPARWVEDPVSGTSIADDADDSEIDIEVGPEDVRCEQCQSVMGRDDIFCGECGFVSRAVTRAFTSDFTGETRQLDLTEPITGPPPPPRKVEPEPIRDPMPEETPKPTPSPTVVPVQEQEPTPPSEPEQTAPALREALRDELVLPEVRRPPVAPPTPPAPSTRPAQPSTGARRSFLDDDLGPEDLEATRIVSRMSGNRFVLQFSTGESFTVHGSGLIGRNPQSEPGEFFDHLVRVLDSGKSVSKTHLEFGQEGGAFWVKDRFSGNGTIIREPDISARRAEPDRRYRVVRGTRIDIGEQFFVVS